MAEELKFRDEPVTPVYRHWLCPQDGCDGEMLGTGHGFATNRTSWEHKCGKCAHEQWAEDHYPKITYL